VFQDFASGLEETCLARYSEHYNEIYIRADEETNLSTEEKADTIAHELAHYFGYDHGVKHRKLTEMIKHKMLASFSS
jgi:predicted SprT family Zn-dependent metalloprotease